MGFDFGRLSVKDVNAAAVRFPTRNTRREALVRISDTRVMLFFELVFNGVGTGVAAQPELFNELLAFFVGLERLIGRTLFIRNDVGYVFIEPLSEHAARVFLFARPFRGLRLFCVFSFGFIFLLGNRPGRRSQKKQGSEGDKDPSSAHKTPLVRLLSIYRY